MSSELAREITETSILRAFDRFPIVDNRPVFTCGHNHREVWFTGPTAHARWVAHRHREHGDHP